MSEFKLNKVGKLCDDFESQAYEWVLTDIQEFFSVETRDLDELSKTQIEQLENFLRSHYDDDVWIEPYSLMALNGIIDSWYTNAEDNNLTTAIEYFDEGLLDK